MFNLFKKKQKKEPSPEVSAEAKKYNIRISTPHGYYPEDVDKTLVQLENDRSFIEKENQHLIQKYQKIEQEKKELQDKLDTINAEFTNYKLQTSLMGISDEKMDELIGDTEVTLVQPASNPFKNFVIAGDSSDAADDVSGDLGGLNGSD